MVAKPIPVFAVHCVDHGWVTFEWYETEADAQGLCNYHNELEHSEAELFLSDLDATKDDWL